MLMTESVGKLGDAEPVCKERKRLNITVTHDVFHSWKFLCKSLPRPTLSKLYRMKLKCDIPGYVVCKVQHMASDRHPQQREMAIYGSPPTKCWRACQRVFRDLRGRCVIAAPDPAPTIACS